MLDPEMARYGELLAHPKARQNIGQYWPENEHKKAPVVRAFEFFPAGYSAGEGFFLNNPARLSQSSILAPCRFMMMPCCRIDRKLFHAQ